MVVILKCMTIEVGPSVACALQDSHNRSPGGTLSSQAEFKRDASLHDEPGIVRIGPRVRAHHHDHVRDPGAVAIEKSIRAQRICIDDPPRTRRVPDDPELRRREDVGANRDRQVDDSPALVASSTKTNSTRPVRVGTVKKSIETRLAA